MKSISLIGSTGSIGTQVCNVVRRYGEKFRIESMVANASSEAFLRQLQEFKPAYAALVNEAEGKRLLIKSLTGCNFIMGKKRRRKQSRTAILPLLPQRALRD